MFYAILIGIVLSIFLFFYISKQNRIANHLFEIREEWGKIPTYSYKLKSAKTLNELNHTFSLENSYKVDLDTWNDLDLNKIFKLLNRTRTPAGGQYLLDVLRHPLLSKEQLEERKNFIQIFSTQKELREQVLMALWGLEHDDSKYLPYSLWRPLPEKPELANYLSFLSLLATSVLFLVVFQVLHYGFLFPILIVNMVVRSILKRKTEQHLYTFQYLGNLIGIAKKISSIPFEELSSIQKKLKDNLTTTEKIAQKMIAAQMKDESGFSEYFHYFFLWDVWSFYSALSNIKEHINKLQNLYEIVGSLDAFISIASFRQQYPQFCHPQFGEQYIVEDIFNPLLEEAVPNSFVFDSQNIMITGSNMAGKSTFLKTIGLNAILAQTINSTLATSYNSPFLKVMSSIARSDSISDGKSYYLAEAESILRLLTASLEDIPHLFIIDEIFRGTNSIERLAASNEVLKYLHNQKDYVLVSTHDLQLSTDLQEEYHNFHFREEMSKDGLIFDYKLHSGISSTRNAIALLGFLGYPDNIVEKALINIEP